MSRLLRFVAPVTLALALLRGRALAEVPESMVGRVIHRVDVRSAAGDETFESGLHLEGLPLSRALLREALLVLLEGGRFSDAEVFVEEDGDGVVLRVRVVRTTRVGRVDVRGNEALSATEVRERLGLDVGVEVSRGDVPAFAERLRQAYREFGYDAARADVRILETDDASAVVVRVDVVEGPPTRVRSLRATGDTLPDLGPVGRAFRDMVGERLQMDDLRTSLDETRDALREAGYYEALFDEPSIARDGVHADVRVPLHLGPRFEILVSGSEPMSRSSVIEGLELAEASFDAAGRAALRERAVDLFRREGYLDAEVDLEVDRSADGTRAEIRLDVRRGPPVVVRRYVFEGNERFDDDFLREQVESYLVDELASGFGAPVDSEVLDRLVGGRPLESLRDHPGTDYVPPDRRFYAPTVERAVEHLQEIYLAEGFVDARVHLEPVERTGARTVEVRVRIEEGPRATFHDVTIRGNDAVTDHDLAQAFAVDRGDPFSDAALNAAVERVLDRYRDEGFLFPEVEQRISFSGDGTHVDVELTIDERFPVTVGAIRIVGLRDTREELVRDLVALVPDEPFTLARARRTEQRLLELGIFSSVVVAPAESEIPAPRKDVVITLTERMPQVLDFGAGLSTGQGVRGSFEYAYRNLFGRAITFSLRAQVSGQFFFLDPVLEQRFAELSLEERLERRITIGLVLPTMGRDPRFRTSLNVLNLRDNAYKFGIDKSAFDVTFAYRPNRALLASVSPTLENNDVNLLVSDETYEDVLSGITNPALRQLIRVPEGRSSLVALGSQLVYDRRDNALAPTSGGFFAANVEWARTLTSSSVDAGGVDTRFFSHHLRLSVTGSAYVRLAERVTLAFQGRYGRIIHLEPMSETFPNRQFFLGGVDSMRAYRQDAMVPQDVIDSLVASGDADIPATALVQGGDTFLLVRSELRFPLASSLSAAVFGEFGNLWADASNFEPWNLRPTAGLGVRIETPVGPIAFDYGLNPLSFKADRQLVGERIGTFNFSIGVY